MPDRKLLRANTIPPAGRKVVAAQNLPRLGRPLLQAFKTFNAFGTASFGPSTSVLVHEASCRCCFSDCVCGLSSTSLDPRLPGVDTCPLLSDTLMRVQARLTC